MYRNKGLLITLALLLLFAQTSMVLAEEIDQSEPKVWVDGQLLRPEVSPTIESGRTLVEMRSIFEALGAELEWDGETRKVTAHHGDKVMMLTIDQMTAILQGQAHELEVPPRIVEGRTVVPLRFVSEALSADVKWDEETRSVMITTDHEESSVVEEVVQEELPEEVASWIENSQNTWLAQEKVVEDIMYLLVTYGEKPTGGYSVDIQQVMESEEEIIVKLSFTQPGEDDIVTQAITYPYDLFSMKPTEKPVVYEVIGDESYVPTLVGLETLSPVMVESRGIKIFSPAPEEKVSNSFTFKGIANVFEGNVLYRLSDEEGEELVFDFTTGAMGDWGAIEETIEIPETIEDGETLLLEFFTESAKDGSIQDLIEIPLYVEKTL